MTEIFLFIFGSIGITNIIVDSNLFAPIRDMLKTILPEKLYEILECHQCCGTWVGFLCGIILFSYNPLLLLVCGGAGSCLTMWSYTLSEFIMSQTSIDFSNFGIDNGEKTDN